MLRYLPIILLAAIGIGRFVLVEESEYTSVTIEQAKGSVQQVRLASNHSITRKQRHLYVDGTLFSGMMVDRDINATDLNGIIFYATYDSGLKNGEEVGFYSSGQQAFLRTWVGGNRNGWTTLWWPNGNLKSTSWYAHDVLEGIHREWFADGTPMREFTYVEGQEEGPQKMWYEDGSIRANYEVRNGRRYGSIGAKGCGLEGIDLLNEASAREATQGERPARATTQSGGPGSSNVTNTTTENKHNDA